MVVSGLRTRRRMAMCLALEVVESAYEEAMRQHGMLHSTITLIRSEVPSVATSPAGTVEEYGNGQAR